MNINKVKSEVKALSKDKPYNLSYYAVLLEIENTIQHVTKLYSSPRITADKKAFLEKTIKEADTRAMAILTILRNQK